MSPRTRITMTQLRILLVEDEKDLAEVIKETFEETGEFKVFILSDASRVKECLEKNPVDAIICDYVIPGTNGMELLRDLKTGQFKDIPFILYTGKGSEEIEKESLKSGAFYYVQKGTSSVDYLMYVTKDVVARKRSVANAPKIIKKMQLHSSSVAHDLKNIFLTLGGYTDLVRRTDDPKSREAMCDKIEKIVEKAIVINKNSESYCQIAGSDEGWIVLKEAMSGIEIRYPNFKFINQVPEDIEIFANPSIFSDIFNCLLDNSQRHGGENVSEIRYSFSKDEKFVRFVFEDNGKGIPTENKSRIFEKGFGDNTGFGLYLARESMEMCDGWIIETGKPGQGARFEILSPFWRYRRGLINQ
ncbi:MAG: hybrid sensor histidine kinase/response regulator [Candidatus Paceibacterota bacterium]